MEGSILDSTMLGIGSTPVIIPGSVLNIHQQCSGGGIVIIRDGEESPVHFNDQQITCERKRNGNDG